LKKIIVVLENLVWRDFYAPIRNISVTSGHGFLGTYHETRARTVKVN
jgi:hypothetical protein